MNEKINKKFLFSILFLISLILVSALIIEYGLGYKSCKLCIYQRIPYFLSILLIVQLFFIKKYEKITLLILSVVFFLSATLAFYHFGIEQGLFSENIACKTQNLLNTSSKNEILEQLKQNNIGCKNVNFKIFGLSLATINTILSIGLTLIFVRLFLNYKKI